MDAEQLEPDRIFLLMLFLSYFVPFGLLLVGGAALLDKYLMWRRRVRRRQMRTIEITDELRRGWWRD